MKVVSLVLWSSSFLRAESVCGGVKARVEIRKRERGGRETETETETEEETGERQRDRGRKKGKKTGRENDVMWVRS